jgi:hypothetical protein
MLGESLVTIAVQRLADLGIITVGRRTKAGSAFKINPPREAKPWARDGGRCARTIIGGSGSPAGDGKRTTGATACRGGALRSSGRPASRQKGRAMTSIPPEIRAALEEVLEYYNYDEEKDFEAREDEDRTHHIYLSLRKIRQWLDETATWRQ